MGKADLHIHTSYSYDSSCSVTAVLGWAASQTDLDVIAITDHDVMGGALEAMQRAPEFGIEVIPGCEITSSEGHLLGLYITKPVPAGRPLLETVLRIGEQGGLCVCAHPTSRLAHGAEAATIRAALRNPQAAQVLVGLETWNTGLFNLRSNTGAQALHQQLRISGTGGSDSHVFWTIGFGYTEFQGCSGAALRRALEAHATTGHRLIGPRSAIYWPNHVINRLLRKLGWVTWTSRPDQRFMLRRVADIQ